MPEIRSRRPVVVRALGPASTRGHVELGGLRLPCALGRTGRLALKREGDGATPLGKLRLLKVLYRRDRVRRPVTGLPVRAIRRDDGWCDAVGDGNYNRLVRHPYPASAENLWRDDHLYNIVIVLDYNVGRRSQGRGSAIFIHLARPEWTPTAGCVALKLRDMRLLLARMRRGASIVISA